jgi:hypothetical protein
MFEGQVAGDRASSQQEQHEVREIIGSQEEFKHQILARFFPSIRYGRDTDLDRYISLRERGKPFKEWKNYYDNLARKYTESERKKLIQSFRKHVHQFQHLFKQILAGLYTRVESLLKRQINTLLSLFTDIIGKDLASFSNKDFFTRIGQALKLFSSDRYEALSHLDLLNDFAQKMHYQAESLEQVTHFIKGYLNGSLFLETKQEETYHFDINEEKAQSPFRQKKVQVSALPMQLLLTDDDLNKIILDDKELNEYELCFAYLDKYMQLLGDEDFATKIFVYSKKYQTEHYQIFDRIRQGINFNHQKERIFDDVFKIVCAGRYVYNIRLEKFISYKLRLLSNTLTRQPARPSSKQEFKHRAKRQAPARSELVARVEEPAVIKPAVKAAAKPAARSPAKSAARNVPASAKHRTPAIHKQSIAKAPTRARKKLAAKERIFVKKTLTGKKKPVSRVQPDRQPPAFRATLSVTAMIAELSEQKRVQRRLTDEFKKRLPAYILEARSFGMLPGAAVDAAPGSKPDKQQEELIHFVMQNYDKILVEHEQTDFYCEHLEQLGSSIHIIYTAILNCLNKLKTDYFTHRDKFEKRAALVFFGG